MPLARLFTFVNGTPIEAPEVNAELNQLIEALNGVDSDKDIIIILDSAALSPLTLDQINVNGPLLRLQRSATDLARVEKLGEFRQRVSSSDFLTAGGIFTSSFTQTGNGAGVETDIYTKTVEADTLNQDGDVMRVESLIFLSNAVANKQVRSYFNGVTIFDSGLLPTSPTPSIFVAKMTHIAMREASNVLRFIISMETNDGHFRNVSTTAVTATLNANRVFKITGQATGANGVTHGWSFIEKLQKR